MNIKIEGNRCRTTSIYNIRVIRAVERLEGMKRWLRNQVLSFENTPYNITLWKQVFPEAVIEGEASPSESPFAALPEAAGAFPAPSRYLPTFRFKTEPRKHQKIAIDKAAPMAAFGLFMDIGTGKSWVGVTLAAMRYCAGLSEHLIIIAPNGVQEQWIYDVDAPFKRHMMSEIKWKGWVYRKGTKIAELEYQKLLEFKGLKILAINIDAIKTKSAEKKILTFIESANGKCTIYIDESQDIKTDSSDRTEKAIKYGRLCSFRLIMTGTPIAKDLTDLYSQFYFLDERIFGHRYITTFKSDYCVYENTDFGPKIVRHKNVEKLYRKIDPYIYRITSDEALDLPQKLMIPRRFHLTDEQLKIMADLKAKFFAEFGDNEKAIVKNAAGLLMRMQQVSCGYLTNEQGEIIDLKENPRLENLLAILDQRSDKVAIWCRFQKDVEIISAALGPRAVTYYGPTGKQDRTKNKIAFINDPKIKEIIFTTDTGGTGLDGLQHVCKTNVYYSNSYNFVDREQSEGRTHRDGTKETVTYFDLIARASPDAGILSNLRGKKNISELTLDGYRKLLSMQSDDNEWEIDDE